ncbi:MAG: hypothetical protein U0528_18755 [Anaerolineae bacterium]
MTNATSTKTEAYRQKLNSLGDWDSFLLAESGIPGPRGNLELAAAAADVGDESRFRQWLQCTADRAPTNTSGEFLAVCGVIGFGRLLAEGRVDLLSAIRKCAVDIRWRVREAVAMALQRWGDADMNALLTEMEEWSNGSLLEQRAAAAALCEPRLLRQPDQVQRVLAILDHSTASLAQHRNADSKVAEALLALKKGLGYCWSVAVVASPNNGKQYMEKWLASDNKDIRWIMRENLKKNRLLKMDAAWVESALQRLNAT